MTEQDVLDAIAKDHLIGAVWMREPVNEVNSIAVYEDEDAWVVVATDERAVRHGQSRHGSESDALERFLRRLRSLNRLKKAGYIG